MTKVAVIGANGQVGAELCLLLGQCPQLELVAICRNRSGSAFLRWQGIPCRHGRVADAIDAKRLLADCDVIVNSALATGTPAEIRRTEDQIIRNMFLCSKPEASIIHFSTQSVYGDPRPNCMVRWRNPYGRAKLASERRVRAEARKTKKQAYILRLGHVCGAMQDISHSIRESIRSGTVVLPAKDCSSNTVYTAAIAGAILQIIRAAAQPGTYDLMNSPPWTWRAVYEYEASGSGRALRAFVADAQERHTWGAGLVGSIARLGARWLFAPRIIEFATKSFAYAPATLNARAMAWWLARRARKEIAALDSVPIPPEHLSWVANGKNLFPAEQPTLEMLKVFNAGQGVRHDVRSWPDDLPDAIAESRYA